MAQPDTGVGQETAGAQTLRRGLAILKLLARYQTSGLGVSDIARKVGLNKATTVRLTRTLMDEQFVAQDPVTRSYRLGPETFAIGLAAEPSYALQRVVAPALRSLALETGDWVFFMIRQGYEAICLSRESGDIRYPPASLRVGDRHPLGVSTGGLAMLAALPDAELELVLEINAPLIARRYPQLPMPTIRQLVQETREKGYTVIPGIQVAGYWGIGVPLIEADGQPVAAIVLVANAHRLNLPRQVVIGERLNRLSRELMSRAGREAAA